MTAFLASLGGGALIGASAALLLLANGRIAGISGILGGLLDGLLGPAARDWAWRAAFLAGLLAGPALYRLAAGHAGHPVVRRQGGRGGTAVTVHFIGAGPGAADLISVRGQRTLASCGVCLYAGSLVPKELLAECPPGARLVDTSWSRVRADELSLARTTWWDGTLTDCRLGAVQAYGSSWTRVTVHGGKVDYLNLRESELVDVVLDGCVVDELALGGATVRRLVLRGSTVRRLDVTAARLVDVDLRGLSGLQHIEGVAGLAGATITGDLLLELAPALAEQLGIQVE